jgi:predicted dinucleotide-binding enzyme
MRIGILGSGAVGQALAVGFSNEGHEVQLGTRDPAAPRIKDWLRQAGAKVSAVTFRDAAQFGEIVALATRWDGTENAIRLVEPASFAGKVVMDVTNPLKHSAGGALSLAVGFSDSGGEQVQRWLPGARVVKVFNTVNAAHMYKPSFPGGPPDMFIAGDDRDAKRQVSEIVRAFDWPVTDVGGLESARLLEALAMLYIRLAIQSGRWDTAWKLLRKSG